MSEHTTYPKACDTLCWNKHNIAEIKANGGRFVKCYENCYFSTVNSKVFASKSICENECFKAFSHCMLSKNPIELFVCDHGKIICDNNCSSNDINNNNDAKKRGVMQTKEQSCMRLCELESLPCRSAAIGTEKAMCDALMKSCERRCLILNKN